MCLVQMNTIKTRPNKSIYLLLVPEVPLLTFFPTPFCLLLFRSNYTANIGEYFQRQHNKNITKPHLFHKSKERERIMLYLPEIDYKMNKPIVVTLSGIIALLLLQGFWLNNSYTKYVNEYTQSINNIFSTSIEKELSLRQL